MSIKVTEEETIITKSNAPKERILGLDVIRTIAIIFVFVTHAITYRGVLDVNPLSVKWTIYMVIRFMAMTCVPLFLLLTGYLNTKKEVSLKYYKGLIPLITSYFCISIMEIVATAFYTHTPVDFKMAVIHILDFSANGYAWYFEMYIGLYLLIPFLNILYENLKTKKEKIVLVSSLAFLTFLPQMVKSFEVEGTWLAILPDYWQMIYPVTYFYIGKMIREYRPKWKMWQRLTLLLITVAIPTTFCYCFTTKTQYAWFIFNGFEALTDAGMAIAIFLLFYDWDTPLLGVQKVISQISICSFEMYLFSSIWDKYLYAQLAYNIFIMVPIIMIVTYLSARLFLLFRNWIFHFVDKTYPMK